MDALPTAPELMVMEFSNCVTRLAFNAVSARRVARSAIWRDELALTRRGLSGQDDDRRRTVGPARNNRAHQIGIVGGFDGLPTWNGALQRIGRGDVGKCARLNRMKRQDRQTLADGSGRREGSVRCEDSAQAKGSVTEAAGFGFRRSAGCASVDPPQPGEMLRHAEALNRKSRRFMARHK